MHRKKWNVGKDLTYGKISASHERMKTLVHALQSGDTKKRFWGQLSDGFEIAMYPICGRYPHGKITEEKRILQ